MGKNKYKYKYIFLPLLIFEYERIFSHFYTKYVIYIFARSTFSEFKINIYIYLARSLPFFGEKACGPFHQFLVALYLKNAKPTIILYVTKAFVRCSCFLVVVHMVGFYGLKQICTRKHEVCKDQSTTYTLSV